MSNYVFPGTFDPITNGHLEIIKRINFKSRDDILYICVCDGRKNTFLDIEDRVSLIKGNLKDINNVICLPNYSTTVDFCVKHNANYIVRGIRNFNDFNYEMQLFNINRILNKNIETIFLFSDIRHSYISSSSVKELFFLKKDISELVPQNVDLFLKKKYKLNLSNSYLKC